MDYTREEVLLFVEENDVKFAKLAFCDLSGRLKNISIPAYDLKQAFLKGVSFDAAAIQGFLNVEDSDLFLFPDPATVKILPWRPAVGRVVRMYCDIRYPDGRLFEGDPRGFLKKATKEAKALGYECKIGSECEFYLFELDEKGNPTTIPYDQAGYLDSAPLDKGENLRREICVTLEEMDILPESSHHEQGPGQQEIDFKYSDALTAADDMVTFKSVVKSIGAGNGLFASFLPKPLSQKSGSGLHVNVSLLKNQVNLFEQKSKESEHFIAGVLNRMKEITLFLNPLTNSYQRFGEFEAPKYISWSHQNRSQLIRIPAATGDASRFELRSPDPSCNPYLAYGLILYAGILGIKNGEKLPKELALNMYTASKEELDGVERLPSSLMEALKEAEESSFLQEVLPGRILKAMITEKTQEAVAYQNAFDKQAYEKDVYFPFI